MDDSIQNLLKITKINDPVLQAPKFAAWISEGNIQDRILHLDQCMQLLLRGSQEMRDVFNPIVLGKALTDILPPQVKKEIHELAVERGFILVAALFSEPHPHVHYPQVQDIPIIDVRQFLPQEEQTQKDPITLGERRTLAKAQNAMVIEKLLMDPDPKVIENVLDNPLMNEKWALKLASHRPLLANTLTTIALHPRWGRNKRVRFALTMNPYTPPHLSLYNLFTLPIKELEIVAQSDYLHAIVQTVAQEILRTKRH